MSMRMVSAALALALMSAVSTARAQVPFPGYVPLPPSLRVGPDAAFEFVSASQRGQQWCWAASVQMILQWHGLVVDQADVVRSIKGSLIDQGGSDSEIQRALNALATTRTGRPGFVVATAGYGPPIPSLLVDELMRGRPLLLTFSTGPYSGHAVVITGAEYVPSPYGPTITSLTIRDPYPTPSNVATRGRSYYSGAELAKFLPRIRNYWIVWGGGG